MPQTKIYIVSIYEKHSSSNQMHDRYILSFYDIMLHDLYINNTVKNATHLISHSDECIFCISTEKMWACGVPESIRVVKVMVTMSKAVDKKYVNCSS
jgi:hypothetical protein